VKVESSTTSSLSSPNGGLQGARQGDAASSAAAAGGAANTQGPSGSAADASVNLSGLSSQMRSLAASGSADIDVAQVASIKEAIQNGTLTIDPGKIASGILETARSLLQNPQSSGG
jgi:negative regulator of flagellin synthesis FlgM